MEEKNVRINKYLAQAGICSRREADKLIEEGAVTVDSVPAVSGMKVGPDNEVRVRGELIRGAAAPRIIALNKPRGVVCSTDRRWGDRLIEDLIPGNERLFSAGRLDKDSEGLILMTNQGDLAQKIMKGRYAHEKEYRVTIDVPVSNEFLKKMGSGLYLPELGKTTRRCRVWKIAEKTFGIVLTQGMNRQIRRMCSVCGAEVTELIRIRIMNITLGDLKSGEFRDLTPQEVRDLEDAVNSREQ